MTDENNSDFQTAAEIIKSLNLKCDVSYEEKIQEFISQWEDTVGNKLAKFSKPQQFSSDGILFIKCKNSVAANEIFSLKAQINAELKAKAEKLEIKNFKYIKITY